MTDREPMSWQLRACLCALNEKDAEIKKLRSALFEATQKLDVWAAEGCDCPAEGHICGFPDLRRVIDLCNDTMMETMRDEGGEEV